MSEDTVGVKLDEYWTVIEGGVKRIPAFTDVSSAQNIAKIRLIPIDDSFGPISGQLTISADGNDPVVIDLTGIAGVPKIVTDKLYDGVKYVPYSSVVMTNCMYGSNSMKFEKIKGTLPAGVSLNPDTGELYGIPTKPGTYTFTIKATYTGEVPMDSDEYSCQREYTIVIEDNTDDFVDAVNEDEQGYTLEERLPREITVYYGFDDIAADEVEDDGTGVEIDIPLEDYPVSDTTIGDSIFKSIGELGEFEYFYLDGKPLERDVDYIAERGSTKITVLAQTFKKLFDTTADVPHTFAAEFRTSENELRRSAQNVYIKNVFPENAGSGSGGASTGGSGSNNSNTSSGNGNTSLMPYFPIYETNKGEVTAVMGVVDRNGNPISGLSLELRSKPKYATTDSNGYVEFGKVEFGKHTLSVLDDQGNKIASKAFTIVSGSAAGIKGSVITAEDNSVVDLSVEFDGKNLKLLAAQEDVSSMAGAFDESSIAWINISYATDTQKFFAILFLIVDFAVAVLLIRKKLNSDK